MCDPETKRGSRNPALFREVLMQYTRRSDVNPVINLTVGAGGDATLGGPDSPLPPNSVGVDIAAHLVTTRSIRCNLLRSRDRPLSRMSKLGCET
ncbi:hypothetical protein [Bradyrhizobium sp. USDA 4518]